MRALAQQYGPQALATLVKLLDAESESARVAAARELLDRGYGKASQSVALSSEMASDAQVTIYLPANGRESPAFPAR